MSAAAMHLPVAGETDGPIGWTGPRWNPIRGCELVSPGCKHCYAKAFAERFVGVPGHPYELGFEPRIVPERLADPLRWQTPARVFVNSMSDPFQGSGDDANDAVPFRYVGAMYGVMAAASSFTFQMLTKRGRTLPLFHRYLDARLFELHARAPELGKDWPNLRILALRDLAREYIAATPKPGRAIDRLMEGCATARWPLPNLHIGVSVESNAFRHRLDEVVRTPTPVPWVSLEPLLGPVDCRPWLPHEHEPMPHGLCERCFGEPVSSRRCRAPNRHDWAESTAQEHVTRPWLRWGVVGLESGNEARRGNLAWIRTIVGHFADAGVPLFVKQLGRRPYSTDPRDREWFGPKMAKDGSIRLTSSKGIDMNEWPPDLRVQQFPTAVAPRDT